MTAHLVVEVPSILPVVLVTAVLCRRALPLHVISQVVFKDAWEGDCRQHAHHRSQSEHQTHHYASKIYSADGIQGHWCERSKKGKREMRRLQVTRRFDPSLTSSVWLESKLIFSVYFHLMLLSHTTGALPLFSVYNRWQQPEILYKYLATGQGRSHWQVGLGLKIQQQWEKGHIFLLVLQVWLA